MSTRRRVISLIVCTSAFVLMAVDARGAAITSVAVNLTVGSTGTIGPFSLVPPAPNNDNTAVASDNLMPSIIFVNSFGISDFDFGLTPSGGPTENFFTQTFVNNTGIPWVGFQHALGFGTGTSFVTSTDIDQLDFDTSDRDPAPTSTAFAVLSHESNLLDWSGAPIPAPGSVMFTFSIDVPDGLAPGRFTLRHVPIAAPVPEPAMLWMLGGGATALAVRRRRRN